MENSVELHYRFEPIPAGIASRPATIAKFGAHVSRYIYTAPWLIADSVFGRAERIADGHLDPGSLAPQVKQHTSSPGPLRLAAIEDSSGPIVEYKYDRSGRVYRVLIRGTLAHEFTWSPEGRLERVVNRDSQSTSFTYTASGWLSETRYPDGAVFKYTYEPVGYLASVLYPDGVEVRFIRNRDLQIVRTECRDVAFEYGFGAGGLPAHMTCQSREGSWELSLGHSKIKQHIQVVPTATHADNFISCMGHWRYDRSSSLQEIFAPTGERLVAKSDPSGDALFSWSHRGQVEYRFDKAGILASIRHWDGTHSVLRRSLLSGQTLLLSAAGIAVLNYDDAGRLVSERSDNGRGALYSYAGGKLPVLVDSGVSVLNLKWKDERLLDQMTIADIATARITYKQDTPVQIEMSTTNCSIAQAINAFIACLWDWQALIRARRIEDVTRNRGV